MKHLSSLNIVIRVALALFLGLVMVIAARISEAADIAERLAGGVSLKRLVALGAVVVVLALGIWLALRRNKRGLIALAGVVLLATAALSAREFLQRYPNQGFLSSERLGDSAAILLGTDIRLGRYQPEPLLVAPRESVTKAEYPVIDIHWHLESQIPAITPDRLVQAMDAAGVAKIADMGGLPNLFKQAASTFAARYPDRFILFVKPDMAAAVSDPNGLESGVAAQVRWIEEAAALGAQGMKISKSLGMGQYDREGRLVAVDDPRLDPLWVKAGQLGMPVLIHTADTEGFFRPADARNERYEEILGNPEWSRYGKPPSRDELFAQRERLLARHPGTSFIGAHMGMQEDDLAKVGALLDRYPNYFVDIAAVVHALGRQPVTARDFFIRYQDRIVFGTDGGYGLVAQQPGWTPERLFQGYFEFLETSNEYVEYPMWGAHNQGRWRIYGLDLPGEVLEKIYVRNAERLIPTREAVAQRLAGE